MSVVKLWKQRDDTDDMLHTSPFRGDELQSLYRYYAVYKKSFLIVPFLKVCCCDAVTEARTCNT